MKRNKFWFVIAMLVMSSLLLVACDESLTDYHTHRYGAWAFTTTPTMDTDGSATRSCECGDEQSVTVANLSDASVWSIEISQEATHATNGYAVYKSTYGTVTTTSDKGQHVYGDWRITTAPTMDAVGSAIKVCDCGHSVTEEVPALTNNIWTKDDTNKPSHDVAGSVIYTSGYGTVTIDVPAGTHSFGKWTANEDGKHSHSCECGTTETLEHAYNQHVANSTTKKSDATCTTGAQYYSSCVCGAVSDSDVFYVGEGTGHEFSEFTLTKNPTCTETGTASVKCEKCDYENDNSVIAALGHTWDEEWHPYFGNNQYWDADTGEVITEEDAESSYHAHACTVCGVFDEANKVGHSYGDTYVTATKEHLGTQMAAEHACVCGYTEDVADNLGYFEHAWTVIDSKEATYNEAGYKKGTHGDYEYTLVIPKLVAPYDGKTYRLVDINSKNDNTIGVASVYSWSAASVTLDENGNGTGISYPLAGENNVTMVDPSTGKITWKIGTTTYNGYVDMTNGIVVFSNENPFAKKVFVASWFEDGELKTNAFAGSFWGSNMAISYTYNCAIGEHEFNIYVDEDGKVTFDVDFVDVNGTAIGAGDIHQANYVKVLKDGVKLGAFAKDSAGDLIATDGHEGSYTVDLGNGNETVILNGIGAFTTSAKSGTYTLVSDKSYTADMYVVVDDANDAYYQITIADGSMTVVKPMVTVTYVVGEYGSAIDPVQANVNIAFTPETPTATSTYVFAGWYLDEGLTESTSKTIIPIADTNITLYACWKSPVRLNVSDEHGTAIDDNIPWGSLLLNNLPDYKADTVKNGYRFTGWYIDANDNGIADEEEDMVDNFTTATDDVTVIADWEWAGNITFEEQSSYTFVYDSANGYWKSNNQGKNSTTATMEFTVTSGIAVVSFDYYCESESESKWDYMTIHYGPDWKSVTAGGNACDWNWKTITTTLDSSIDNTNQRVRITYQKDSSGGYGSDTAYIRNLKVNGIPVAAQQPLNKDIAGTYTCGDTTVKVGAGGLAEIGDNESSYTVISDVDNVNVIGVVLTDGYREITLNKEAGTCTIVTPHVTVTYNYGGHGDNSMTSVDKMTTQTLAEKPTASGFKFRGWYTDAEFTTKAAATFVAANDVTFYAKWDKAVTITYNYNDGDAHANATDTTYYANDEVTSLQTVDFTYGDKVFVGWFTKDGTDDDWGDAYALDTVITDDITLYAKWVVPHALAGSYKGYNVYYASTVSNKTLEIDAFGKVTGDRTGTVSDYDSSTGKFKLGSYYCFYDDVTHMIVISNGSSTTSFGSDTYFFFRCESTDSTVTTSSNDIVSWNNNKSRLIAFTINKSTTPTYVFLNDATVTANVTWSAKKKDYTDVANLKDVKDNAIMLSVTAGSTTYYYAKNSSGSFVTATNTDIQGKYTDGDDYIVINGAGVIYINDAKGTYTVGTDGTIAALTSDANYVITLDKTNNTFTKADNTVTITYVNDKITVEPDSVYVNIWSDLKTPADVDGFKFRGWYTKDGTDGDWGTNVNRVIPTENVTYYAKYDAAVTITYDYNGYTDADGNGSSTVTTKYVNDTVGTLSTVLNDAEFGDKVFVGWFTKDGTDDDWGTEVTTSTTLTDNVTYYAKWIVPTALAGTYKGFEVYGSTAQNGTDKTNSQLSTIVLTVNSIGTFSGTRSISGTLSATDFNVTNGKIDLTRYAYVSDVLGGIVVFGYSDNKSTIGSDYYIGFRNYANITNVAYSAIAVDDIYTTWITVSYKDDGVMREMNLFVYNNEIIANVSWTKDITAKQCANADSVVMYDKDGKAFIKKSGSAMVYNDGMNGTYTATEDKGLGSIILDGYGSVTIGETTVSYDIDGTKITFVYNNRMYVLTLATGTYTQVQDGYQGTYTMPDGSTTVTLDGYGAIDGTTKTYVVNGTTVTVYDGETSTNYGIDTTDKKLLGKSIFAGLTFTGNSYTITFDDSPAISGKFASSSYPKYEYNFTGTYVDGVLTITITSQNYNMGFIGKTITANVEDGKIVFTSSFKYDNSTDINGTTATCADFKA